MTSPTVTTDHGFPAVPLPVPLLDTAHRATGPATRASTRRLLGGLAAWGVVMTAVAWVLDGWRATLALGLLFPGGGFVAHLGHGGVGHVVGHVALVVLSVVLVAVAYALWVGTGNLLAVPVVWVATAGWAALMGNGAAMVWDGAKVAVPLLAVLAVVALAIPVQRQHARTLAARPGVNAMLTAAAPTTRGDCGGPARAADGRGADTGGARPAAVPVGPRAAAGRAVQRLRRAGPVS